MRPYASLLHATNNRKTRLFPVLERKTGKDMPLLSSTPINATPVDLPPVKCHRFSRRSHGQATPTSRKAAPITTSSLFTANNSLRIPWWKFYIGRTPEFITARSVYSHHAMLFATRTKAPYHCRATKTIQSNARSLDSMCKPSPHPRRIESSCHHTSSEKPFFDTDWVSALATP